MRLKESRQPIFRNLRGYAFDPSLSLRIDTAKINKIIYKVNWEPLEPGPIGEYLEVIDYDPTVATFYKPVDLDEKDILAEDGLRPSVSNPKFHQKMVYAVAMITIQNFEMALGRKIIWASKITGGRPFEEYVQRLRIYPHALRDANAYYSPTKKALLFGYFTSTPADRVIHMPNSLVFTCLSHDIIAHEVTHAILDGIHRSFNNPTNPDMLAFHEAFADIVALFQHFTYPEVLRYEIAKTKGRLSDQNLLGKLAYEMGAAIGGYSSLRDAIGKINPNTKEWEPHVPTADEYETAMQPHKRGSILVAAIFEAFITIYESRISDLVRLSTGGSGVLPEGALHPDLVNRMANEAAKASKHVLNMCIRALDYCPPVDLTFGDFLRAIITADADLIAYDDRGYRLAFVDAFRKRGIYPTDIKTLSLETLIYPKLDLTYSGEAENRIKGNLICPKHQNQSNIIFNKLIESLVKYSQEMQYITNREEIFRTTRKFIAGNFEDESAVFEHGLHKKISEEFSSSPLFSLLTGLVFLEKFQSLGIKKSVWNMASFSIENLRVVSRVGPKGKQLNNVVFSIMQRCYCRRLENGKIEIVQNVSNRDVEKSNVFTFYGGATMIFDLEKHEFRYIISKPLLKTGNSNLTSESQFDIDLERAKAQYQYQYEDINLMLGENRRYFGTKADDFALLEPFAILHSQ